jgi:D-3-phosphoglycerate dehydrogenase
MVLHPTPSSVAVGRGGSGPPTALLVENIHHRAAEVLEEAGYRVRSLPHALAEESLMAELDGVELLGVRSRTRVTEAVLEAAPDLLAVGAFGIGVDQIDLAAATARGVAVFNAPFSNTRSVVELALAEIVALSRRLTEKDAAMHAGVWDKSADGSHEVRGRRLGIVGYGKIGSQLSVLAENLGMSVFFYDVADRLALGNARRCASLEELLEAVDVVSLHVDGRPQNSGLFGEAEFSRMRPGSLFLNLSRGFVVDHEALRRHLETGHLAGAAIDVFPDEPGGRGQEFRSILRGLSNVILTPHIGGSTEEAQEDIGGYVAEKLRDYWADGKSLMSVNLPELALERRAGGGRVAYLHRNHPGALARMNSVLATAGLNIEAQVLETRGQVGYAIADLDGECPRSALDQLGRLPEAIRVRLLP